MHRREGYIPPEKTKTTVAETIASFALVGFVPLGPRKGHA